MSKIVICIKCDGTGRTVIDVGSHKSEYKYSRCAECKGSGRLVKIEYLPEYKPFVPGKDKATRLF